MINSADIALIQRLIHRTVAESLAFTVELRWDDVLEDMRPMLVVTYNEREIAQINPGNFVLGTRY